MADRRLILKGAAALPPRELSNEPHTTDGYEQNRGIAPGKLVCDWVKEMAPYFKSLAPLQMITTGVHCCQDIHTVVGIVQPQQRCMFLESARGAAVCTWARLDVGTAGEEGYRSEGNKQEPHAWINNGQKGVDFVCNVNVPTIDFATVHVYPGTH